MSMQNFSRSIGVLACCLVFLVVRQALDGRQPFG